MQKLVYLLELSCCDNVMYVFCHTYSTDSELNNRENRGLFFPTYIGLLQLTVCYYDIYMMDSFSADVLTCDLDVEIFLISNRAAAPHCVQPPGFNHRLPSTQ